jgi:hypothetical protein
MSLAMRFRSAVVCVVMGMLGAAGSYACGSSGSAGGPPDNAGMDSSTPTDSTTGDDSSMGSDSMGTGGDGAGETSTGSDAPHEGQASSGDSGQADVFVPDGFLETFDATMDTSITTERDTGSMFPMPDGPTLPLD